MPLINDPRIIRDSPPKGLTHGTQPTACRWLHVLQEVMPYTHGVSHHSSASHFVTRDNLQSIYTESRLCVPGRLSLQQHIAPRILL